MTTLSSSSIEWALTHLESYPDTDIFPPAFEYAALNYCRDEVIKWLCKVDISQWQARLHRRCLVPKQRYGFRIATQLDPLDMLFFMALTIEAGAAIESARLPASSNLAYSYRFSPNNQTFQLFDVTIGYNEFQDRSRQLAKKYSHVVLTDIADFYPRIYLHRIENALDSALPNLPQHSRALKRLIKDWNQGVSIGLPIGNSPARLLAELVIDDIDRLLFSEDFAFIRYVDDYRIFCNSVEEGHRCLAHLAEVLYQNHFLTLQGQKTNIVTSKHFVATVLETESRGALEALAQRFTDIVDVLGLDNPYGPIEYETLPTELQVQVDALNLESLLEEQLQQGEIDIPMTKFLLNRLGRLRRVVNLKTLFGNLDKLYPVFNEFIRYLADIGPVLDAQTRSKIGISLLIRLEGTVISHLEYHRMLIMSLFAGSTAWGNQNKLAGKHHISSESWFQRCFLLALGKADQQAWIRTKKSEAMQMAPWVRRAFLYAASCLPADELKHYYKHIKGHLDPLESFIIQWAQKKPVNLP